VCVCVCVFSQFCVSLFSLQYIVLYLLPIILCVASCIVLEMESHNMPHLDTAYKCRVYSSLFKCSFF
jgi:hypothetical protein